MRSEGGGFAALLDEARPEPKPSANQTRTRDRVNPSEKAEAASGAPASNRPDSQTNRPDSPSTETASSPTETAAISDDPTQAANEAAPASIATALLLTESAPQPGELGPAAMAEGIPDETLAAIAEATPEPALPDATVAAPVAVPTIPAAEPSGTPVPVTVAVPEQAAPEPALPGMDEKPSEVTEGAGAGDSAGAGAATAAAAAAAIPAAAEPAKPVVPTAAPEQSGLIAPSVKPMAVIAADETGEDAAEPTDIATEQSGTGDTDAEATATTQTLQPPKKTRASAETSNHTAAVSPNATPDQPAPQPDAAAKPDDTILATKPGIDPAPQTAQLAVPAYTASTAAVTPQTMPVTTAQAVPVDAIAVEIASQARAGNSRFEIRLDPPELGRIDVRLDVDREGNVKSRLVIERSDTYDLLRRDQSTLERALQQAGLKTSDNSLEFSLRDQGFAQQRDADDGSRRTRAMIQEAEVAPSEAANGYARLLGARGGIDIRV
jgi:flagellar hook-length control protein FliK